MAENQIKFGVGFDVDKSGLDHSLNAIKSLKSELGNLSKLSVSDVMKVNNSSLNDAQGQLNTIKETALTVESALAKAFNSKLGTINIQTFNNELTKSGSSLQKVQETLKAGGTQGVNAFRSLANAVTSTNTQLKQTHTYLDKMATTLGNTIKWNISSGVFNALTGSMQQAYGYVKALDGALNDIQIVTQKSSDEMAQFAKNANDAAKNLGTTTVDYTKSALTFYQQGLSDEEVKARADLTNKVANTSGLSADDAAEYVTAVLNGYEVGSENAEKAMDVLANVGAHTASSLSELSEAMSKVSSTANTMGVSEEQLAASLATVIQTTRQDASSVGTAFKTIYMRISDITSGAEGAEVTLGNYTKQMAEMGVNVLDSTGHLRDLGEVMEEIGSGWENMSKEQQIALARTMAGTRQANNLLALFDNWSTYSEALGYASDATGTLQKQQDIYMESTGAHLNQLKASWEDVYDSVLDAKDINSIADALGKLGNITATWVDSLKGGSGVLTTLGALALNVFSKQIAGSINTTISNLITAKQNANQLEQALEEIQTIREKNKSSVNDDFISKLMDLKEQSYNLSEFISPEDASQLKGLFNNLTEQTILVDTLKKDKEAMEDFLHSLDSTKDYNLDNFAENFDDIENRIEDLNKSFEEAKEDISKYGKDIKQALDIDWSKADKKIKKDAFSEAKQSAQGMIDTVKKLNNEGKLSPDIWKRTEEAIKRYNEAIENAGEDQTKAQAAMDDLERSLNRSVNASQSRAAQIEDALIAQFGGVSESISELLKKAEDEATRTGKTIEEVFRNAASKEFITSITQMVGGVASLASSIHNLKNLGNIWTNDDLKTGEKIAQTLTNVTTSLPMMAKGYKTVWSATKKASEISAGFTEVLKTEIFNHTAAAGANSLHAASWEALNAAVKANPIGTALTALAAAVTVVTAVKTVVDALTMSAKEANEQLKDLNEDMRSFADSAKAYNEHTTKLEELKEEYNELSAIAGEYDKNIDDLTSSQRNRYNEIKDTILSYNEDALLYWNDQGEAILKNNDALERTIDLLNEKFRAEREALYNDDFKKNTEAYDISYSEAKKNYSEVNENASKILDKDAAYDILGNSYSKSTVNQISGEVVKIDDIIHKAVQKIDKNSNDATKALMKVKELRSKLTDDVEDVKNFSFEGLKKAVMPILSETQMEDVNKYIDSIQTQIKDYDIGVENASADLEKAEKDLQDAAQIDPSWVLGVIQNNKLNNQNWNELEAMGVENSESMVAAYIRGLTLGKNGIETYQDAYDAVNDYIAQLISTFEANPETNGKIEAAAKNFGEQSFKTYKNYLSTLKGEIGKLLEDEGIKKLKEENPDYLEALLNSVFGTTDIEFNGDELGSFKTSYTEKISQFQKDLKEISGRDYSENQISTALPMDQLDNLDYIIENIDAEAAADGRLKEAIKAVVAAKEKLNNIDSASTSVELLEAVQDAVDDNVLVTYSQYSQKLIELAEQYDSTGQAAAQFKAALSFSKDNVDENIDDDQFKDLKIKLVDAAQGTLLLSTRAAELAKNYDVAAEDIECYAKQLKESGDYADATAVELAELAKDQLRFNKAVISSQENLEDWNKDLAVANKTGQLEIETQKELAEAYGNLLDIDGSQLRSGFLENAENLALMQQALDGDIEAYQQLQALAAQEILIGLGLSDEEALDQFNNDLATIQEYSFDNMGTFVELAAGAHIEDQGFLDELTNMVNAAGMTAEKATDYLSSMGVDATVKETTETVPTTNTYSGATANVDWVNVPVATPAFGAWGFSFANYKIPNINYEPNSVEVSGQTEQAAIGLEVTSASKSSGGNIKSANSAPRNGGSSSKAPKKTGGGGGGGGGKGKGSTPKQPKIKESSKDKIDPFHDINIAIDKLSKRYSELTKAQDKLTGKDLIKNLNAQLKILEKQRDAYAQKVELATQEANSIKQQLKNYGATFGTEGEISNYASFLTSAEKKLNDTIAKYNNMTEEQQEKFEDQVEAAQKEYDKIKELINDYDDLINDTIPGLEEQIMDALYSEIEIRITEFNIELQIRLDMSEAERDWNSFKRRIIDGIEDDNLLGQAQGAKSDFLSYYQTRDANGKVINRTGQVQTGTNKINDILEELAIMDAGSHSSVYSAYDASTDTWVDDRKSALEDLKTTYEQLMDDLTALKDLEDNVEQAFLDSIDAVQTAYDKQSEIYGFFGDQIEHDVKMIQLLYGEDAYGKLADYYDKQIESDKVQVSSLQNQVAYWKQLMDAARDAGDTEAYEKYRDNWMKSVQDLNSMIEQWAESLTTQYANTIKKVIDELNSALTDAKGLTYIDEELNLLNSNADMYLDTINAAYSLQKLQNMWQEGIDNTDNITGQRELNTLMEQQLTYLKEKGELTQYDIDRAELEYQIALKQIALQEAQQNKSTMRLKRDANGNYSYQYVSDESAVADAQKELADAQNELYNFDKSAYQNNLNEIYSVWNEFQEKIAQAYVDYAGDQEKLSEMTALYQEQYGEKISRLTESNLTIRSGLYDSAFTELAGLYNTDVAAFQQMSLDEKNIIMNDLIPQWDSGVQEMADKIAGGGGFQEICSQAFADLGVAADEYNEKQKEIGQISDEIGQQIYNEQDILQTEAETAISLAQQERNAIAEVRAEVQGLITDYKAAESAAIAATKAAYSYWQQEQKTSAKNSSSSTSSGSGSTSTSSGGGSKSGNIGMSSGSVDFTPSNSGESGSGSGISTGSGSGSKSGNIGMVSGSVDFTPSNSGSSSSSGKTATSDIIKGIAAAIWCESSNGWGNDPGRRQKLTSKFDASTASQVQSYINAHANNGDLYSYWVNQLHKNAKAYHYDRFYRGGLANYTGPAWVDGSPSNPEMVLNPSDTSNMINAVSVLRGIVDSLGSNALASAAALLDGLSLNNVDNNSNNQKMLEQTVNITATFEGQTEADQIQTALDNLINVASQRAYRSKK